MCIGVGQGLATVVENPGGVTEGGNAARIRAAIERWNSGDREAPLDDIDPEVEIRTGIGDAFQGEPFRGHEGARMARGPGRELRDLEIVMDECR